MKIVNIRHYDAVNLGDDLFIKILIDRYRNKFLVNYAAYRVVKKESANNIKKRNSFTVSNLTKILRRVLRNCFYIVPDQLNKGNLLVYIGGSLFIENNNLDAWKREKQFYDSLGKPYYILGSNIGPYSSPEFIEIVRSIFSRAEDVCLRDSYSYKLVKDLDNVRLATDIVFTLDVSKYKCDAESNNHVISVIDASRKFDSETSKKYNETIAKIIKKLLADNESSVTLMSFCEKEGDENACATIMSLLPEGIKDKVEIYRYRGNISEALQVLAGTKTIIGSRFHANILGMVFGKKILPIAYSDKTINILSDMKYPGPIIDIRSIDSFNINELDFDDIQVVDISKLKTLAEKQFSELDKVLVKK